MRSSEITPAALHPTASVTAPKNGASRIDLRNNRRARFSRSGAVKGSRRVFLTVVCRRRVQLCLARPASSLLLEPTPDPNELMQQPEAGPCGLEYSHSSPEKCIGETSGNSEPAGDSQFTTRELEVLASLAKGKSNKMIGRELNMREGTVKVHVRSLLKKLNATNRTQLALRAYRALDTAQAVSGGGLTIPAEPAAGQGSTDT